MGLQKYDLYSPDGRQAFIINTWPGTAGVAYAGYKSYGRGAVAFAPGHNYPMFVPLKGNDFGNPEIVKTVQMYDPEKEIVVIFFLIGTDMVFDRFSVDNVPPATAYKMFVRIT